MSFRLRVLTLELRLDKSANDGRQVAPLIAFDTILTVEPLGSAVEQVSEPRGLHRLLD